MKKIFLFFSGLAMVFILVCGSAWASKADVINTDDWYEYNNNSGAHSFSIRFPSDWQVRIIDDRIQGFAPKNKYREPPFLLIQEFEGQSYNGVIDYFKDENLSFISTSDVLVDTEDGDLLGKEVIYQKKSSGKKLSITMYKRGSLIVAIVPQAVGYEEIFATMSKTVSFNDGWHTYLDFNNRYTFIFPARFELKTFDSGVEIRSRSGLETVFTIIKKEGTSLDSINERSEPFDFHDLKAALASYTEGDRSFSRILVEKNLDLFSLTNVDQGSDSSSTADYSEYLGEITESFEFFDDVIEDNTPDYKNFSDVTDTHPNSRAINSLFKDKVISGYENGTFMPDGEINRAELAKMIVASKTSPSNSGYHDCFPDVKQEWFAPYVCYAKSYGWVEGYDDGNFRPDSKVSRIEAVKLILSGFFGKIGATEVLKDQSVGDIRPEEWYGKYFIFADNRDLLDKQHIRTEGDGYLFLPSENITRKEIAEMIYRIKNISAAE